VARYRDITSTDTPFISYAGRHAAIIGGGDAALTRVPELHR